MKNAKKVDLQISGEGGVVENAATWENQIKNSKEIFYRNKIFKPIKNFQNFLNISRTCT